jgi:hypothetical protein
MAQDIKQVDIVFHYPPELTQLLINALVRMFEQALKFANALSPDRRDDLVSRLGRVRTISHDFGYGVGDDMDFLLSKYTRS